MSNNPLKQYFRRPSIYIRLPSSGRYYGSSVIDLPEGGEIPVFPMTAVDEITSRTPDSLFNGHAVADIISSCIPSIKDPWSINTIDLDALLMAIRVASSGEEMDMSSTCPACRSEGKFGLNLVELMASQGDVDYGETLKVRDLEVKFRPLTYRQRNKNMLNQYEIQKILVLIEEMTDAEGKKQKTDEAVDRLNKILVDAYTDTIESIRTPETTVVEAEYIREFLENCDRQTSKVIKDRSAELSNRNQLKPFNIKCSECGHEYEQPLILNITDFFV